MIWVVLALASAIIDGTKNVFQKYAIRNHSPWAVSVIENILSTLLFIPAAVIEWSLPSKPVAYLLLMLGGTIWAAIAALAYFSLKTTAVTLRAPLSQTRLLFALLLGVIFLHETITVEKITGTALILAGTMLLAYHKRKFLGRLNDPGVQFAILGAFLGAVVAIIDKTALNYFTAGVYGFLIYLVPTIILGIFVFSSTTKHTATKDAWAKQKTTIIIIAVLATAAYYLALRAYTRAEVTAVYPVLRLSVLISMVASALIFQDEREDLIRRLIGAVFTIVGAFLIVGVL